MCSKASANFTRPTSGGHGKILWAQPDTKTDRICQLYAKPDRGQNLELWQEKQSRRKHCTQNETHEALPRYVLVAVSTLMVSPWFTNRGTCKDKLTPKMLNEEDLMSQQILRSTSWKPTTILHARQNNHIFADDTASMCLKLVATLSVVEFSCPLLPAALFNFHSWEFWRRKSLDSWQLYPASHAIQHCLYLNDGPCFKCGWLGAWGRSIALQPRVWGGDS